MTAPAATPSTPAPSGTTAPKGSDVSFRNAAYRRQEPDWQLVEDCYNGTRALWAKMDDYFPKGHKESPTRRNYRVKLSRFYNGVEVTVHGLTGLALRKPMTLGKSASAKIKERAENIDARGTHLQVFSRELMDLGWRHGHSCFLVDAMPAPDLGRRPTKADASKLAALPYFVLYRADQVINFRVANREDGSEYKSLVVLEETPMVPDGDFGERESKSYRVFRCDGTTVTFEEWEEQRTAEGKLVTVKTERAGTVAHVNDIPLVTYFPGRRLGTLESKPPLLPLAEMNLDLHTVQIDHRFAMAIANRPTFVRKGGKTEAGKPAIVGGEAGIQLTEQWHDAKWLELSGSSLTNSRDEMKDILSRMTSFGLQFLAPETRAAETERAKIIDQAEKTSRLANAALALKDAIEQGFVFFSQMTGEPEAEVEVTLDVTGLTLDSGKIANYTTLVRERMITRETLWSILLAAGELPPDFDPKKEAEKLDAELALALASEPRPGEKDDEDEDDDDDDEEAKRRKGGAGVPPGQKAAA